MTVISKGHVIKIEGTNLNADTAMGWYLGMDGLPPQEIAAKFMSGISEEIAGRVQPGDILVCGRNFGYGKVHTSLFTAMGVLGVEYIVAESLATQIIQTGLMFGGKFLEVPGIMDIVSDGDEIEINTETAEVKNLTTNVSIVGKPFPKYVQDVMSDGGHFKHLGKKIYIQKMMEAQKKQ